MHLPALDGVIARIPEIDGFADADVLDKIHVREDDILLLSGSLVDGSGTPSSDFDFCVIAPEKDDRFHRDTFPREGHMRFYTSDERVKESFDYLPGGLLGVNAEYWTEAEILAMLDAHHRLYEYMTRRARKSSSFAAFKVDFRMLSRLTYAVPLHNAERFALIAEHVNRDEACYTAFRTCVGSYPDFRDLAGMLAQGDDASALLAARKLGADTVRGLTHLFGNTNRNPKYLARFVARLPERLQDLATRFRTLQVRDSAEFGDLRSAVLAWLDLVDDAFGEIRASRDDAPAFPGGDVFIAQLRAELHDSMAWHDEITNEYSFRAREAVDGEPSLRQLIDALVKRSPVSSALPLREWAAGLPAPHGENNRTDR